jgi:hypothetical protein
MVKIYKSTKGKLIVYLPFDVVDGLSLKEDDEVDFFRMNEKSFILAKKSDITNMIMGKPQVQVQPKAAAQQLSQMQQSRSSQQMPDENIAVLKKIDTLRYENRTPENVSKLLNEQEKRILQRLVADKSVSIFKKNSKETYSISKDIYDRFLMRKKPGAPAQMAPMPKAAPVTAAQKSAPAVPRYVSTPRFTPPAGADLNDPEVLSLEKNGFLVLQTEAEAGRVSLTLENSIRHGQILGTRAFNKKFYIVRRSYFDKNSGNILKKLRDKSYKVAELAQDLSIDEDGARAILYLLSENGDVSEKKRDTFTIA